MYVKKVKKPKKPETPKSYPRGITPNGQRIFDFMFTHKAGTNYRDFVLFVGDDMLDFRETQHVQRTDGSTAIKLVHKADLHNFIDPEHAAKFWNRRLRRRASFGEAGTT